jgi:hypothetical protein
VCIAQVEGAWHGGKGDSGCVSGQHTMGEWERWGMQTRGWGKIGGEGKGVQDLGRPDVIESAKKHVQTEILYSHMPHLSHMSLPLIAHQPEVQKGHSGVLPFPLPSPTLLTLAGTLLPPPSPPPGWHTPRGEGEKSGQCASTYGEGEGLGKWGEVGVGKDEMAQLQEVGSVMNLPCPSRKQTDENKINTLKRRARDFMGQQRSSDDDVQTSYLESADNYKYDTLAIARLIVH